MCGIVGSFVPVGNHRSDLKTVVSMRERLSHRGPDGHGEWQSTSQRCALGHTRLAIIDLSDNAAQPMTNEAGSVTIVFNGEIYNHTDIRRILEIEGSFTWKTHHSDTETLLRAYEMWGTACIERLNGMFAFAVFDQRNPDAPQLHMFRDRAGIKPLYFTKTNKGEWLFSSEIKALFAHPDVKKELEPVSLWHYLTFAVSPAPLTMFKGIFKLPAGHSISVSSDGNARANRWWQAIPSKNETLSSADLSLDEAAAQLENLLAASVQRRTLADVRIGTLLSGGVDSGLITALMSRYAPGRVSTYTVGYDKAEAFNEFDTAQRVSKHLSTEHREFRISEQQVLKKLPDIIAAQDEPISDNVCIPLYFLAENVKNDGTSVIHVGEGADEHFLGYWWCQHFLDQSHLVKTQRQNNTLWQRVLARFFPNASNTPLIDPTLANRHTRQEHLFWGGHNCFVENARAQLTPNISAYHALAEPINCPVDGLLPDLGEQLDSHSVVAAHMSELERLAPPEILQTMTFIESRMRLPEHLLMRVDKNDHGIWARSAGAVFRSRSNRIRSQTAARI